MKSLHFPILPALLFLVSATALGQPYFRTPATSFLREGSAHWEEPIALWFHKQTRQTVEEMKPPEFTVSTLSVLEAEKVDLRAYGKQAGYHNETLDKTMEVMEKVRDYLDKPRWGREYSRQSVAQRREAFDETFAAYRNDLPEAFYLYANGLAGRRPQMPSGQGELADLRAPWLQILEEKPEGYEFRVLWTHYILGRSYPDDSEKALYHLNKVRELHRGGVSDPYGLASRTYAGEAEVYYQQGKYDRALALYLKNIAAGHRDYPSIRLTIHQALKTDDETLLALASDPLFRRIVTARLAGRGEHPAHERMHQQNRLRWEYVLTQTEADEPSVPAYLRALYAYRSGNLSEFRRWIAKIPEDELIRLWLEARLLIKDGEHEKALPLYQQALVMSEKLSSLDENSTNEETHFPYYLNPWRTSRELQGETGLLLVYLQRYPEAVRMLQKTSPFDATLLAERFLTIEELQTFFEETDHKETFSRYQQGTIRDYFAEVLGRRLARQGRWEEAIPLFPEEPRPEQYPNLRQRTEGTFHLRETVAKIAHHLGEANNTNLTDTQRATAYWQAAQLVRNHGIEVSATIHTPDMAAYLGRFIGRRADHPDKEENSDIMTLLYEREKDLFQNSAPSPNKRFHYRFVAADLGWEAAELMPDNDEQTAYVLWQSGRWIRNEPELADRFYKALVRRNPETELSQKAEALRWFPPPAE